MSSKIGIGITTCDRVDYFEQCFKSVKKSIEEYTDYCLVVHDDGSAKNYKAIESIVGDTTIIRSNCEREGVARAKNRIINHLLQEDCDYFFIIEDDCIVKSPEVYQLYIDAYLTSKIEHFNFGPGAPGNLVNNEHFDLNNRDSLNLDNKPNPRLVVEYKNGVQVAFYKHCAALFSFYTKYCIGQIGLMDVRFYNAWEHIDHTYRVYKFGITTPFWWFADIANSDKYLYSINDSIVKSVISEDKTKWLEHVRQGAEIFKKKHGDYPANIPDTDKSLVIEMLKDLEEDEP